MLYRRGPTLWAEGLDQSPILFHPQCQAHPIPLYESNNYIYLCSKFTIVTMVVTFSLDQSTIDSLLEPNVWLATQWAHAQCFPRCLLFVSPVLWENNSYLENLFSSKSRKLYQQNTSVVLVSVKNSAHLSADAQISPEIDQFRSWITGVLAFLKKT